MGLRLALPGRQLCWMMMTVRVIVKVGMGFDIVEFRRGEEGYSPVCHVYSFEPHDPMLGFEKSIAEVDPRLITDTGQILYCPQPPRSEAR